MFKTEFVCIMIWHLMKERKKKGQYKLQIVAHQQVLYEMALCQPAQNPALST